MIYLREDQEVKLEELVARRGEAKSVLVREAIDLLIAKYTPPKPPVTESPLVIKPGQFEDLWRRPIRPHGATQDVFIDRDGNKISEARWRELLSADAATKN